MNTKFFDRTRQTLTRDGRGAVTIQARRREVFYELADIPKEEPVFRLEDLSDLKIDRIDFHDIPPFLANILLSFPGVNPKFRDFYVARACAHPIPGKNFSPNGLCPACIVRNALQNPVQMAVYEAHPPWIQDNFKACFPGIEKDSKQFGRLVRNIYNSTIGLARNFNWRFSFGRTGLEDTLRERWAFYLRVQRLRVEKAEEDLQFMRTARRVDAEKVLAAQELYDERLKNCSEMQRLFDLLGSCMISREVETRIDNFFASPHFLITANTKVAINAGESAESVELRRIVQEKADNPEREQVDVFPIPQRLRHTTDLKKLVRKDVVDEWLETHTPNDDIHNQTPILEHQQQLRTYVPKNAATRRQQHSSFRGVRNTKPLPEKTTSDESSASSDDESSFVPLSESLKYM